MSAVYPHPLRSVSAGGLLASWKHQPGLEHHFSGLLTIPTTNTQYTLGHFSWHRLGNFTQTNHRSKQLHLTRKTTNKGNK